MSRSAALICMLAGLVLMSAMVFQANAAMMTYYVTFNAAGFDPVAPVEPVTGSFTITFDPTQSYTAETSGITLNSLNINLDSAVAFTYPYVGSSGDTLLVGGEQNGSKNILAGTNDFGLVIDNFTTSEPSFYAFLYSQTNQTSVYVAFPAGEIGSISGSVTSQPVPPSVLLLGSGLVGLGALSWRRKRG